MFLFIGSFDRNVYKQIKYRDLMYNIDILSPEFVKCLEQGEQEAITALLSMLSTYYVEDKKGELEF